MVGQVVLAAIVTAAAMDASFHSKELTCNTANIHIKTQQTIQVFKFNGKLQRDMRKQSKKKCVSSHSNKKKSSPIYILHLSFITANSATHVYFTYILMCACVLCMFLQLFT